MRDDLVQGGGRHDPRWMAMDEVISGVIWTGAKTWVCGEGRRGRWCAGRRGTKVDGEGEE